MMSDIKNGSSQCYSGYALSQWHNQQKMKNVKMIRNRFFSLHSLGLALYRDLSRLRAGGSAWSAQLFTLEREERERAFGGIWLTLRRKLFHLVCLNVTFISQTSIKWSAVLNLILWGQLRRPFWWFFSAWCRLDVDLLPGFSKLTDSNIFALLRAL